jgi:hypothetical protein
MQLILMKPRTFQPGFRLSVFDSAVLIAGAGASAYAMTIDRWFGVAVAFVVLHFFLFCNVIRMSRPLELAWACIFAGTAVLRISLEAFSWTWVFAVSLLTTLVVAAIEIRRPSYHGVGWHRLNPRLPEWWRAAQEGAGHD